MGLEVHAKSEAGGFAYAIVGRGTACVRSDAERVTVDSFRSLLAASEREEQRLGIPLVQVAWYLPRVTILDDPHDLGWAAVSYLGRHPSVLGVHVVAPEIGLIRIVVDLVARAVPALVIRLSDSTDVAANALRELEPDLPMRWYDLGALPAPGGRLPSLRPPSMAPPRRDEPEGRRVSSRPPSSRPRGG